MFFWVDIGPTKSYGQPWKNADWYFSWRYSIYSRSVFNSYQDLKKVDLVFVDGRFRVAGVMSSLLNIEKNFTLVVGNYFDRPEYNVISQKLGNPHTSIHNTEIFEIDRTTLKFSSIKNCLTTHTKVPR